MSELLERAAAELITHPPREAPGVHEFRRRLNRRRGRRSAVLGITIAAVIIVGLVAVSGRSGGAKNLPRTRESRVPWRPTVSRHVLR
jgi:hypothetical protein